MADPTPNLSVTLETATTTNNAATVYYQIRNNNSFRIPLMQTALVVNGAEQQTFNFTIGAGEEKSLFFDQTFALPESEELMFCVRVNWAQDSTDTQFSGGPQSCEDFVVPVETTPQDPTWNAGQTNELVISTATSNLGDGVTRGYRFVVGPDSTGAGPSVQQVTRSWGGTVDNNDVITRRTGHTVVEGTVYSRATSSQNADIFEVTGNIFAFEADPGLAIHANGGLIGPQEVMSMSGQLTDPATCEGFAHPATQGHWEIQNGQCTWVEDTTGGNGSDGGTDGGDGTNGGTDGGGGTNGGTGGTDGSDGTDGTGGGGGGVTFPDVPLSVVIAGASLAIALSRRKN